MQPALPAAALVCDYRSRRSQSASTRVKVMVAGVAVASAGALAVNPVVATPTVPNLSDVRSATVELTAFDNPLEVLNEHAAKTINRLLTSGADGATAAGAVLSSLANPGFQEELASFIRTNVANPLLIVTQLLQAPGQYGGRIIEALRDAGAGGGLNANQLPELLKTIVGYVAQGEFVEAFSAFNNWFLIDVLSPGRTALLDALLIPGDFAESIGAAPLGRVLDATFSRAMLGDFARALLGPAVTTTFQTAEVMDGIVAAVRAGDLLSLVSHVINAPIRIISAFVNGYVPGFAIDPTTPNPTGQVFPGLFGPRGTFDFFFRNLPTAIANAIKPPAPVVVPVTADFAPTPVADVSFGDSTIMLATEPADDTAFASLDTARESAAAPAEEIVGDVAGTAPAPADDNAVADNEETETSDDSTDATETSDDSTDATETSDDSTDATETSDDSIDADSTPEASAPSGLNAASSKSGAKSPRSVKTSRSAGSGSAR